MDKSFLKIDGVVLPGAPDFLVEQFNEIEEILKGMKPGERKSRTFIARTNDDKENIITVSLHCGTTMSLDIIDDGSDAYQACAERFEKLRTVLLKSLEPSSESPSARESSNSSRTAFLIAPSIAGCRRSNSSTEIGFVDSSGVSAGMLMLISDSPFDS